MILMETLLFLRKNLIFYKNQVSISKRIKPKKEKVINFNGFHWHTSCSPLQNNFKNSNERKLCCLRMTTGFLKGHLPPKICDEIVSYALSKKEQESATGTPTESTSEKERKK